MKTNKEPVEVESAALVNLGTSLAKVSSRWYDCVKAMEECAKHMKKLEDSYNALMETKKHIIHVIHVRGVSKII